MQRSRVRMPPEYRVDPIDRLQHDSTLALQRASDYALTTTVCSRPGPTPTPQKRAPEISSSAFT